MRTLDLDAAAPEPLAIEVTSWFGDADPVEVPVVAGTWRVTDTDGVKVPGEVEFSVPASDAWKPIAPDHPLNAFGQRFRVRVGYGEQLVTWGWYRAKRPQLAGSVIQCSGVGLLRDVERARFTRPHQTTAGQTRSQVLADLLRGILPLAVEGVSDPVLPVTTWEAERLDAVWEVVESWPARLTVDESATAVVSPAWDDTNPGDPVASFVDGDGGTLVALTPGGDTDDDLPNAYVVSTVPEGDAEPVTEVWTVPDGPMAWGGPYGYNPAFFASPMNPTDRVQLRAIAERMTRRVIGQAKRVTFSAVPNVLVEVGDVVYLRSARAGVDGPGRIINLSLTRSGLTGQAVVLG